MSNQYIEAITQGGDGTRPEKKFPLAVTEHWNDPKELHRIAEAYCYIGDFAATIPLYKRILKINRRWIDVNDHCARAYWALHDYRNARRMWNRFLAKRRAGYRRLGLPATFHTVDDVFTSAFGNFAHYYPIARDGYQSSNDIFYYHKTRISEGNRSLLPSHNKIVSNEALRQRFFTGGDIPEALMAKLDKDDYVTRLPFYAARGARRRVTHFHNAFAERMLEAHRADKTVPLGFSDKTVAHCKAKLVGLGINPDRPFVTVHCRESGYWARNGDRTHSTKNARIADYIPAINFLITAGFQVIRLGDPSMAKLPPREGVIDYAHTVAKDDFVDLYLLKHSAFMICTCSGPFAVAAMFHTPILATNYIPVHLLPFAAHDRILLKKLRRKDNGNLLSLQEMLDLPFGEFTYYMMERRGLEVVDNTPEEIVHAVQTMVAQLQNPQPNRERHRLRDWWGLRPSRARFFGREVISEATFVTEVV